MLDFRLPQNRREFFIRWFVWGLRTTDCDPTIQMINYIFHRQELNIEQRIWLVWLYSISYQLPTAYLIWNEFPDFENCDYDRIKEWESNNYSRIVYQVDCKWNRGHLHSMYKSYKDHVGNQSQISFYKNICNSSDPKENYENLRSFAINNMFKFGRYITWMLCHHLKANTGLNIDATSLLLGENGSDSHTDGMCYVANREDLLTRFYINGVKHKNTSRIIPDDKKLLQDLADSILEEIKIRFPDVKADYFLMETALCSFKKLFRKNRGRYLGYYLDRQAEDIHKIQSNNWSGVDWDIMWQYRKECLNHYYVRELHSDFKEKRGWIDQRKMCEFLDTGSLSELNQYEDLENK